MSDVFLAGYSDKLSVREGDKIQFFVSSFSKSTFQHLYSGRYALIQIQMVLELLKKTLVYFSQRQVIRSRIQDINPGSYARSVDKIVHKNFRLCK